MDTQIQRITPAVAANWLKKNTRNRVPNLRLVDLYASEMSSGNWMLNGASIAFSRDGMLIDGQKRLMACVKSGRPFESIVVTGAENDAYLTIDIGERRRHDQTLHIEGFTNNRLRAAVLAFIDRVYSDDLQRRQRSYTNQQIVDLAAAHDVDESLLVAARVCNRTKMNRTMVAGFHYVMSNIDRQKAQSFFEIMRDGIGCTKEHPVYHLRERMLKNTGTTKMTDELACALFIISWNKFYRGVPVKQLKWMPNCDQEFPRIEGLLWRKGDLL